MNIDDLRPGMWITQNLLSHQGDYFIMRIGYIEKNFVHFDIHISIRKTRHGIYPGSLIVRESARELHKGVLLKSMFREMKRPRQDIKMAAIRTIFEARNIN